MNTAETLKNITDRALFEQISNSVLRLKFDELSNLIEGGLNEKGETVKGALDSFCRIGDDHFALIEHTTNNSSLEAKWLYDTNTYSGKKKKPDQPEGDLIKAIRNANKIRKTISNAKFTIYLTTNQNVNSDLWTQVVMVCASANISIEIIELKTIANFLDTNPEGQFLRMKFLGIEEEVLSADLFQQIQLESLNQYATEFFIDPNTIVHDWNLCELTDRVQNSICQLTILLAESGFGKSTLCYNYFSSCIKRKGACLRVSAKVAADSNTLMDAIEKSMRQLKPNIFLNVKSRQLIWHLSPTIIIDDLNKESNPLKLLEKLVSWSVSEQKEQTKLKIICPVWPRHLAELPNKENKKDFYDYFTFGKPHAAVTHQIAKKWLTQNNIVLSELEVNELVRKSDRDPLLLNLSLNLIKNNYPHFNTAGDHVVRSFVYDRMDTIPSGKIIPKVKKKILLSQIGLSMLRNKNIAPTYVELTAWNKNEIDVIKLIDEISCVGDLFLFDNNGLIQYRHDRIRDYILSEGLSYAVEDKNAYIETLTDPYFSRQLGYTIASKTLADQELMDMIRISPQGIFNCLKYLQNSESKVKMEMVVKTIKKWKKTEDYKNIHSNVLFAISTDLLEINTTDIKEITENMPASISLFAAQLRNGDALGGIHFFMSYSEFEPFFSNKYRDFIIEHVSIYHQDSIVNELTLLFSQQRLTESGLKGILLLCGYLKDFRLIRPVMDCWEKFPDDTLIQYYLWTIINCFNENTKADVFYFFDNFMLLPYDVNDVSGYPKSVRHRTLYEFSKIRWKLKDQQIRILGEVSQVYKTLVTSVFNHIDHPVAMKVMIDITANRLERADPESSYALFHPGDKWDFKKNGYRLSSQCIVLLQKYWQDNNNSIEQRKVSFRYWTDNAEDELVLPILKNVDKSDILYEKSLYYRAYLRDKSVTDELLEMTKQDPYAVRLIALIWNKECINGYRDFFNSQKQNFKRTEVLHVLVEVLRGIPTIEAEELLVEFWSYIKFDCFGVQTALYIATPTTIKLASDEIFASPEPQKLFQFVDQCFGFFDNDKASRITIDKLQTLQPYFSYIDKFHLEELADFCLRSGFNDWLTTVLAPHLDNNKVKKVWPTANDLALEVKQEISKNNGRFWLWELEHRKIRHELIILSLEIFSTMIETDDEFKVLAELISEIGNRKDLAILENVSNDCLDVKKKDFAIIGATYNVQNRTLS